MPRFHPLVRRDVSAALLHYDSIDDSLGDDFWAEFERVCGDRLKRRIGIQIPWQS